MPDPNTLRACVLRFTEARVAHARRSGPETEQEVRDTAYTLCVLTGTRSVREAILTADWILARADRAPGDAAAAAPAYDPARSRTGSAGSVPVAA